MGLEYYLVREDNKTAFDLGKGEWQRVFGTSDEPIPFVLTSKYVSVENLAGMIEWLFDNDIDYAKQVATKIFSWAEKGSVVFINENYNQLVDKFIFEHGIITKDDDKRDITITASRYTKNG
jgi:hypothetical protein